jgi:hypothetical protein
MSKTAEFSDPKGFADSRMLEGNFDLLAVNADHSPEIIDFQFPRISLPGLLLPCDDAMLCSITYFLYILRMIFGSGITSGVQLPLTMV